MQNNVLFFMTEPLPPEIDQLIYVGRFKEAERELKKLIEKASASQKGRLIFELDRLKRWQKEYPYSFNEAFNLLKEELTGLTSHELIELIKHGCVDHKIIEGEIRVLRRFIPNLFWLCPELEARRIKKSDPKREKSRKLLRERAQKIIKKASEDGDGYLLSVKYRVKMEIKIKPEAVPIGEKVKIWVPIPQQCDLHPKVEIIAYSSGLKKISQADHPQRTAYFEATMEENGVNEWIQYEFVALGFYRKIDPAKVEHYDEESEVYRKYVVERPPHIVFTPYLKTLTKKVVGSEENPYLKAKRIWKWITHNIRYTYAHDYALYDNIPEYVARKKRGDCGMQALLFITMCRIAGVPARWQSSWYMNPISHGMHDWAQFYVEPYGWLYADPSFGGVRRHGEKWRNEFYFGNIEGYRLAANTEISYQFTPPKKYVRSDPVDSQRGEVEWAGGNLYYDKWDYKFTIEEFQELNEEE